MKKYLKNQDGMALPMVLVIMVILSMFATSLAMFAYNSYITVRWMNDDKRAYYLSRAGVEATSYAYQNAVTKTSGFFNDINQYSLFTNIDKFIAVSQDSDAIIKTNKVYLVCSPSSENDGTMWEGLSFSSDPSVASSPDCIGYFEVDVGNGTDQVSVGEASGTTAMQDVAVKVFRSTAVCNGRTQVSMGYISPPENVASSNLYNEYGYLTTDGVTAEQAETSGTEGKFIKDERYIRYDTAIESDGDGFFSRIFKGLIKAVFKLLNQEGRNVTLYIKTAEGNLALSKPSTAKYIKTNNNMDNFYIFATTKNLFLNDVGLQVTPTKGNYATIGLYGDQIIVDGDITMEVYYTNPDALLGDKLTSTFEMIGNRFRLGTVVLGDASLLGPTRRDPVPIDEGGLKCGGESVPANKIYFNGNVFIKLYTQGGSTETYRIFNAGDMAYFYGGYTMSAKQGNEDITVKGIDLVKYFIDAVIAKKDGHVYGDALVQKMKKINELYYGSTESSYFTDDDVLIRKIQVKYSNNGQVEVDGGYGKVTDIIQPSPIDSSTLSWGKPRKGCVFD